MELPKDKLMDALSLTRERVRVWAFGNLDIQKLSSTQKKDRHPLPALSHRKMGEGAERVLWANVSPFIDSFYQGESIKADRVE